MQCGIPHREDGSLYGLYKSLPSKRGGAVLIGRAVGLVHCADPAEPAAQWSSKGYWGLWLLTLSWGLANGQMDRLLPMNLEGVQAS